MTQNKININEYFTTSDLSLAVALSLFFPIEGIDRTEPRRSQFQFKQSKELDETVTAYWRNELKVDAQTYFTQLRTVKTRLYE